MGAVGLPIFSSVLSHWGILPLLVATNYTPPLKAVNCRSVLPLRQNLSGQHAVEKESNGMPTFTAQRNKSGFCRVTKQQRCRICGKPDWCSFSANGAFSICMRIRAGAVKINRHGGGIFPHENADVLTQVSSRYPVALTNPLAPIKVRDFAYRWLIEHSPARRYHRALIAEPRGLLARGFNAEQLDRYGALPNRVSERDELTQQLLHATGQQFPDCIALNGIPGFWEDEHGAHLWQPYLDRAVRLLIPVRDECGRIQACQLRHPRSRNARYCWLSSAKLPNGAGSGSPLHFNFQLDALPRGVPIFIVEGFLKADALAALRPDTPIIATGGVAANHAEIIRLTQARPVVVAFDQDYHTNETVCRHLAALLAARIANEGTVDSARVAVWPRPAKGIDDAALLGLPLSFLSVAEWYGQLRMDFRALVAEGWQTRGLALPG